jgi:fibronectin type 3 domain-containing protein
MIPHDWTPISRTIRHKDGYHLMNRMRMLLASLTLLVGLGFVGCNTEDYNLRVIKEDRHLVSADSTSTHMKWRTNKWTNTYAKQWASASVIITTVDNTLDSDPSPYWLKKIVSKGFKGIVLIDEEFQYLPFSWESEPAGSYKNDMWIYFTETIANENWAVTDKAVTAAAAIVTHPDLGQCYLPNPATMSSVWGTGAYDILNTHIASLVSYVGGSATNFQVGLFQQYNAASWRALSDTELPVEVANADPLELDYSVAQYTPSDMAQFTTFSDDRMVFVRNKGLTLVVYGNRVDTNTDHLIDGSVDGVFFTDANSSTIEDILAKATIYRATFTPESSEQSLLLIGGIKYDVYHTGTPVEYAQLLKKLIDNAMYFTPGANGSYFEYPQYKPGDWWVRYKDDYIWQNNRNNPTYLSVAEYPRKVYDITPVTPPTDITAPAAPTNLEATPADGGVSLNWDNNGEVDLSYYRVYINANGGVGDYSVLQDHVIPSYFDDIEGIVGFDYYYKVKAIDINGNVSEFSNAAHGAPFDATAPVAPTSLAAVNGSQDYTLAISWGTVADAHHYHLYRDAGNGTIVSLANNIMTASYADNGAATYPGATLQYQVTAIDASGNESVRSATLLSTTVNFLPPSDPSTLSVVGGERLVTVSWTATKPADFGSFIVYRGLTSGSMTELTRVSDSPFVDTDITVDVEYFYKVSSIDTANNESNPTSPASSTPFDSEGPGTITSVTATGGDTNIQLTWTNPTDADLDHVAIYRGTSAGFAIGSPISEPTGNSYLDTPLSASTTYYYKLYAVDTYGNVSTSASNEAYATTDQPPIVVDNPPAAPSAATLTTTLSNQDGVALSWVANVEADMSHYNVYRGAAPDETGTKINVSNVTGTTYNDTSAQKFTNYYYRITAVDAAGHESTASTPSKLGRRTDNTGPEVPADVTVVGSDSRVRISWSAVANAEGDFSHYIVYRGTQWVKTPLPAATNVVETTFMDITAVNGSPYYYGVASVDIYGNLSALGTHVSSVTPQDNVAPGDIVVFSVTPSHLTLSLVWLKPEGSDIGSYEILRADTQVGAETTSTVYATVPSTQLTYIDTPLTNGVEKWYSVRAVDLVGNRAVRSTATMGNPFNDTTPPATLDFVATAGDGQVVLTWGEAGNIEQRPDYFTLYAATSVSGQEISSTIPAIADNIHDSIYTHTSLANGTTYYYQLRYTTEEGIISARTAVISAKPQTATAPLTPANFAITVVNGSHVGSTIVNPTISLSWSAAAGATVYNIYRGTDTGAETFLTSTTGTTWNDTVYNATTAPNGFINGSPYYYKIAALNTTTNPPLMSTVSGEVSGTARCIRTMPFPFYYANWEVDPLSAPLTNTQVTELAQFDGIIANTFAFEPSAQEPAYWSDGGLVNRLRAINPDLVYLTYVGINSTRFDWEGLPASYDNTPFKEVFTWARDTDSNGIVDNNGYMKYAYTFTHYCYRHKDINGNPTIVTHTKGDKLEGGPFDVFILNWAHPDLADKLAEIYVRAYEASPVNGEYTGLMLDFLNGDFQDWICDSFANGGCATSMDADGDGVAYGTQGHPITGVGATGDRLYYNYLYNQFSRDVLAAFRREFANRKMTNRLLVVNGNRGLYDSFAGTADPLGDPIVMETRPTSPQTAQWLDGWFMEQWNDINGVPGWHTTGSGMDAAAMGSLITTLRTNYATSQVKPAAIAFESMADSNIQYMSEAISMASYGWTHENTSEPGATRRGQMARGEIYQIPPRLGDRLPAATVAGTSYSITNNTLTPAGTTYPAWSQGLGDTLVVEADSYKLYMTLSKLESGSTANPAVLHPWSYYASRNSDGATLRLGQYWPAIAGPPSGLSAASSVTGGSIVLTWNANPHPEYVDHYNVYRGLSIGGITEPVGSSVTTSYTNTGTADGTLYYYQITSVSNRGTHPESKRSNTTAMASSDTYPPGAVTLTATGQDSRVLLDWNDATDAVSYSVIENGGLIPVVTGLVTSSYTRTGLTNGTPYTYKVVAVDARGNVTNSNTVEATPAAAAENLTFTSGPTLGTVANSGGYVQFSWSAQLGIAANSKTIYYKNAESLPDTTVDWKTWTTEQTQLPTPTITTAIPTPLRDSSANVSLVWVQTDGGSLTHYHIERKVDNGSWATISTGVLSGTTTYLDSAPRGKLEYRISAADGTHGVSETVGDPVVLSKVDTSTGTAVYNEATELHVVVDICRNGVDILRSTDIPATVFAAPDITAPTVAGLIATAVFDTTTRSDVKIVYTVTALETVEAWMQWKVGSGGTYGPSDPNWIASNGSYVCTQTISTNLATDANELKGGPSIYTRFALRDAALNTSAWVESSTVFRRKPVLVGSVATITIPDLVVPGTTNMTNFPLLLTQANLPSGIFAGSTNHGGDIRFTIDAEGFNFIPREVVTFNTTTSTAEIWVRIPVLYATAATTIYCWYGDPAKTEPTVGSASYARDVWVDYSLVFHMTESGNLIDSTTGKVGTKLTAGQPTTATGKIGGAQNFTGATPAAPYIISVPYDSSFDIGTGDATWSVWSSYNGVAGFVSHTNGTGGSSGYWWKIPNWPANPNCVGFTMGDRDHASLAMPWVNGAYSMITVTKAASDITVYRNGQSYGGSPTSGSETNNITNWNGPLLIGLSRSVYSTTACTSAMDEFRLCRTARDTNWLTAEYNNQNAPAAFATVSSSRDASQPIVNIEEQ